MSIEDEIMEIVGDFGEGPTQVHVKYVVFIDHDHKEYNVPIDGFRKWLMYQFALQLRDVANVFEQSSELD